jgi:hypothetical protein
VNTSEVPVTSQLPTQQTTAAALLLPAYGSLSAEFNLFDSTKLNGLLEGCWGIALDTRAQLQRLQPDRYDTSGKQGPASHLDYDSNLDTDEDEECRWDRGMAAEQHAAVDRIREASSIQGAMEACLGYEGWEQPSNMLQQVGEGICGGGDLCGADGGADV